MLVIGKKYNFIDLELKVLQRKFKHIDIIDYSEENSRDIRLELESLIRKNSYHYIVINTKDYVDPKMIKFLTILQFRIQHKHIRIITIEKFLEKFLEKCYIPDFDSDLKFLSDIHSYNLFEYIFKRFIDYIASLILFVALFFLKLYVKKIVKEQSPGNIFFIQKRVGFCNKQFGCIKFRSMHIGAEKGGEKFATKNDDRVFKFGNFMRTTRIDEVPQCINILKGDMHLIGPRPERKYWINFFEKDIPYYNERHLVKPGITGWAQVNYPYGSSTEDAKQKLMYDLYYIKYWSIWLEIRIIFKTIGVIIRRKGT